MATKTTVTNTATLAELQAAIDSFDVVEFTAGQAFQLTGYLSIKSPTKLTTSAGNPATIRRAVDNNRAIVLNASNIEIANLIFDFNFSGGWEDFAAILTFNIPSGDAQTQNVISGARIHGVDFIDSAGTVTHSGNGDSWGIVFTNDAAAGVQDVKVLGCRMLAPNRQLTAGGAGGGVHGCEIAYCYVSQGRSNSIAVSNRFNDGTEGDDVLSSINVHHNVLVGNFSTGVFIGRDGSDDPDIDVSMTNVTIADNYMQLRPGSTEFAKGILIKSGTSGDSVFSNVSILRNKIVNEPSDSTTTRIVDIKGPAAGSSSVTIQDNESIGRTGYNIDNLTIIQSGNTNNNSAFTFLSS